MRAALLYLLVMAAYVIKEAVSTLETDFFLAVLSGNASIAMGAMCLTDRSTRSLLTCASRLLPATGFHAGDLLVHLGHLRELSAVRPSQGVLLRPGL
jgi:hypothetical protein